MEKTTGSLNVSDFINNSLFSKNEVMKVAHFMTSKIL
jgi:hypothetical protein